MQARFADNEGIGVIRTTPNGAAYLSEDGWRVIPLTKAELQQLTSGGANADKDHDGHEQSGSNAGERP